MSHTAAKGHFGINCLVPKIRKCFQFNWLIVTFFTKNKQVVAIFMGERSFGAFERIYRGFSKFLNLIINGLCIPLKLDQHPPIILLSHQISSRLMVPI
ncbi:hypothetical protein DFQ59_108162 [Thioalbus denitrificans]|uniref:Uncharacterized protein n=1 Tax=Thioalbus denitrificans TaxID=547122 RepID=A0A369C8L1_9GAMM|nr:hypothetical protein DFQ59_108162 [Thioalbus denitrificans]